MVLIFNQGALVVALIALIFLSPVALLWKFDVIEENTAFLVGSWLLFAASFIGIKTGLKDRVFFIFPTWLITLPLALYTSFIFFGKVLSIAKIVLLVILAIIILIALLALFALFISEKKKIRNLHNVEIIIPEKKDGILNYWKGINDLFFFPVFLKWTDSIYAHNIKVLNHLKEKEVIILHSEDFLKELNRMKNSILKGDKETINSRPSKSRF